MPRKSLKVVPFRKARTASFKLSVCKVAEKKGNRAAGREFGIDESNVRRWLAQKAKLLEIPGHQKAQRGGRAKWPKLEEQLIIWITEERQQGNSTSISALRRKAREFAEEAGIGDFTASFSWASGFMGRHGNSTSKLTSKTMPRKSLKVVSFRKAHSASFKLSVCKVAEKKGNRAAGREFGIDESNVRRWLAQKAKLLEIPGHQKAQRGGRAKWPKLEEQLIIWITEERQQGNSTSISALRRKAREFAEEAGIGDFTASFSWASAFMGRHGISTSKLTSKTLPEDLEENMNLLRLVFKEEIDDEDFEGF